MGEVGISRHEFLFVLRLWEINAIVAGYRRRERTHWQATRWQTWCILNCLGAKLNTEQELLRFPWEEDEGEELSDSDVADLQAMIREVNASASKPQADFGP